MVMSSVYNSCLEYEFKTDKAPQQKITPVPNDIMVGNVSNSYYVPGTWYIILLVYVYYGFGFEFVNLYHLLCCASFSGDSGVGTCNLGVTSDTFTMFSEDKVIFVCVCVHTCVCF